MKKITFLILTSLALFSCSDDDSGGSALKPTTVAINQSGNAIGTITFTYDNDDRIQSLNSGANTFVFTYNSKGKTDRITLDDSYYQFSYDADDHLSAITNEQGGLIPVTYSGNGTYTIDDQTYSYTASGDFSSLENFTFTYSSGKGAFAHVKSFDAFALYFIDVFSFAYANKKRSQTISNGVDVPFVHTAGESGLPATTALDNTTFTYTYAQ